MSLAPPLEPSYKQVIATPPITTTAAAPPLVKKTPAPAPPSGFGPKHYYSTYAKRINNVDTSITLADHVRKKFDEDSCIDLVLADKNEKIRHSIFSRNDFKRTVDESTTVKNETAVAMKRIFDSGKRPQFQFSPGHRLQHLTDG